jgi:hypothetical protein
LKLVQGISICKAFNSAYEFGAGSHSEFAVGVAEMKLDGLWAQEECRGSFAGRDPLRHGQRNLQLLRSERSQAAVGVA